MGEGGIHDEMLQIARQQGVVSTSGRPSPRQAMAVLKMRRRAQHSRRRAPAVLFSSTHAREWIAARSAAAVGWFAAQGRAGRPCSRRARSGSCDPEPAATLHVPAARRRNTLPGQRTPTNRFWRKTLRDNNDDGIYGNPGDGVDPNRNYPAKRGIDEEGATNTHLRRDLPRPVRPVGAREPRVRPAAAEAPLQGQRQLPLGRAAAADAGLLHHRLRAQRRDDLQRDDGRRRRRRSRAVHAAALVGSLRVQRRHDRQRLPQLRRDRLDARSSTRARPAAARTAATSSTSPTTRGRSQAIFEKNLPMALNIVHSADQLDRPRNFENDPGQYQVKPTQDIQINDVRRLLRRDAGRSRRSCRKSLGPVDVNASISGPGGSTRTVVLRAEDAPAGERYGDAPGRVLPPRARDDARELGDARPSRCATRSPGDMVSAVGARRRVCASA